MDTSTTEAEDSLWKQKPWWCQPWTILLTGVVVTLCSWLVVRIWWLTLLTGVGVLLWWLLFLVLVPSAWREAQRNPAEP